MSLKTLLAVASAGLCATSIGHAAEGWAQMKSGMNRLETAAVLGTPLFKNTGRGFELWIYDSGAEVVCYRGTVVAWTAPAGTGGTEGRQLDLRPFLKPVPVPKPVSVPVAEPEASLDLIPVRQMRLPRI